MDAKGSKPHTPRRGEQSRADREEREEGENRRPLLTEMRPRDNNCRFLFSSILRNVTPSRRTVFWQEMLPRPSLFTRMSFVAQVINIIAYLLHSISIELDISFSQPKVPNVFCFVGLVPPWKGKGRNERDKHEKDNEREEGGWLVKAPSHYASYLCFPQTRTDRNSAGRRVGGSMECCISVKSIVLNFQGQEPHAIIIQLLYVRNVGFKE